MMSLVSYQLNSYLLLILEEPNISIDTATYFKTCISKEGCCPTGVDHNHSQLHFVSCPGYPMFLRFIALIMIVDIIQGTWSLRHCCLRKPMLPHNDGHFKGVTCAHAVLCIYLVFLLATLNILIRTLISLYNLRPKRDDYIIFYDEKSKMSSYTFTSAILAQKLMVSCILLQLSHWNLGNKICTPVSQISNTLYFNLVSDLDICIR